MAAENLNDERVSNADDGYEVELEAREDSAAVNGMDWIANVYSVVVGMIIRLTYAHAVDGARFSRCI